LVTDGQNGRLFYNYSISKDLLRKLPAGSNHSGSFHEKVPQEPPKKFLFHKRRYVRHLEILFPSKKLLARGSLNFHINKENSRNKAALDNGGARSEWIGREDAMIVLVEASVLTVGLNGREEVLQELPIRVIAMQSGIKAARSLKTEKVDSVISDWDLEDMADGRFVKGLRAAKHDIPTIVFIRAGDAAQEIAARSLGVSAVLTDEADDELFLQTVADVLGVKDVISIKAISPVDSTGSPQAENAKSLYEKLRISK
jgi:DNA-binding NarL/FixJ family response regulator